MDNQVSGRQGKSEQIDHKLYKYNRQRDQAGAVSKRCGLGIRQQGVVTKEQKLHLQKWFLKCGPQIREPSAMPGNWLEMQISLKKKQNSGGGA